MDEFIKRDKIKTKKRKQNNTFHYSGDIKVWMVFSTWICSIQKYNLIGFAELVLFV